VPNFPSVSGVLTELQRLEVAGVRMPDDLDFRLVESASDEFSTLEECGMQPSDRPAKMARLRELLERPFKPLMQFEGMTARLANEIVSTFVDFPVFMLDDELVKVCYKRRNIKCESDRERVALQGWISEVASAIFLISEEFDIIHIAPSIDAGTISELNRKLANADIVLRTQGYPGVAEIMRFVAGLVSLKWRPSDVGVQKDTQEVLLDVLKDFAFEPFLSVTVQLPHMLNSCSAIEAKLLKTPQFVISSQKASEINMAMTIGGAIKVIHDEGLSQDEADEARTCLHIWTTRFVRLTAVIIALSDVDEFIGKLVSCESSLVFLNNRLREKESIMRTLGMPDMGNLVRHVLGFPSIS